MGSRDQRWLHKLLGDLRGHSLLKWNAPTLQHLGEPSFILRWQKAAPHPGQLKRKWWALCTSRKTDPKRGVGSYTPRRTG
ncbi:hypothetical protein FKM82_028414 [Ascaphus truei]